MKLKPNLKQFIVMLKKIVYRPIYANTCFDADGLQLITKAVENTITTGKPSDFVQ